MFSHLALYIVLELSGPLAQEPLRAVSAGVNKEGPVLPRGCLSAVSTMSLLVRFYNWVIDSNVWPELVMVVSDALLNPFGFV